MRKGPKRRASRLKRLRPKPRRLRRRSKRKKAEAAKVAEEARLRKTEAQQAAEEHARLRNLSDGAEANASSPTSGAKANLTLSSNTSANVTAKEAKSLLQLNGVVATAPAPA